MGSWTVTAVIPAKCRYRPRYHLTPLRCGGLRGTPKRNTSRLLKQASVESMGDSVGIPMIPFVYLPSA